MLEKKILAFEVKVTPEAQKLADKLGVKIFVGDIMHEVIEAYMKNLKDEKEKELAAVEEEAYLSTFLCCSHASGMGPNAMVAEAGTCETLSHKFKGTCLRESNCG
uniref:eukaryotic translation initiation factor 5B-like n=1 Tax=Fragaria vesca subsp. vesca TaxID=101020 RepID=UPI0005CA570E|nr:PREDICTED: eukaryotic translation initiation factor 5B-like [Fragaria vesca subsp. vesca]